MDLHEEIDLRTGDHRYIIHIAAREIMLISEVGKQVPREITDSQKLSDKFALLSLVARAIEGLEAQRAQAEEWPSDAPRA